MIFLAVGTQFPFDRLVKVVDSVLDDSSQDGELFAQIGQSSYKPRNFKSVAYLDKQRFDRYFKEASAIISHAGMGMIMMALDYEKPLLVMPRLKKYGEVVNNHQVAIATRFSELRHILVAHSEEELPQKVQLLKTFRPVPRENQAKAVADRIRRFLDSLT